MKISFNILKIIFVALIFTSVPGHVLSSDLVQIKYNPVTANLTIKAEDANLGGVLALVSHKTGVWIHIDTSIEKRITINLNNISLESVLRQLSRGLSHAMIYESLNNGDGQRLVGIEIVSNKSAHGRELNSYGSTNTQFLADATKGGSFFTDHGSRDNGSPQPSSEIHDQSTVDNAGIGSRLDMAPEQPSDLTIAEFTPVAGDAGLDENAGDIIPIDSDTEQPAYTSNERIVSPMEGTTASNYAEGIFAPTQ